MKALNLFIIPLTLLVFFSCKQSSNENEQEGNATESMQQQPPIDQQMQQNSQAQDISDEELEKFVEIDMQLQPMQQQAQQEMIATVEGKGMEVEKFQEIAQAQQQGNTADFTENELQNFTEINEELAEIDNQLQQDMKTKIEEEGVTIERYQQIAMAINQDQGLQQKLQQIFQEKMSGQGGPGGQ
jgi:hypothetical protein